MSTDDQHPSDECDLLILGASFTGIEIMHQLRRMGTLSSIETVVVDAQARHAYVPLVHELVAGAPQPNRYVVSTAEYISSLPRTRYVEDTVASLDGPRRLVRLGSGRVFCARAIVIALGSTLTPPQELSGPFEPSAAKFLHQSHELARRLEASPPGRIAVIGGGITGVEMAGELAMWAKRRNAHFEVCLIHAEQQILTQQHETVGRHALRLLRDLGVEVLLDTRVHSIGRDHLVLTQGEGTADGSASRRSLDYVLSVWAGGIRPFAVSAELQVYRAADGWIEVDPWLRCKTLQGDTLPGIFAGGDAVRVHDGSGRWKTMQRAIECIWQGKVLARNVSAYLRRPDEPTLADARDLCRHRLIRDFPYGISIGPHSLVSYGGWVVNLRALGVAFRRWLMRRYFARYSAPK